MPPKKKTTEPKANAAASGSGANAGDDDGKVTMSEGDLNFIIACMKNTTGGSVTVDIKKIAEITGMTNPKSASNKLSTIRIKYGIPLHASGSGAAKSAGPPAANDASVPKTSSAKVTKAKAPAKAKATKKVPAKKATSKGKKAAKKEPTPEADDEKDDSSLSEHDSEDSGPVDEISDEMLNKMTDEEREAYVKKVEKSTFGRSGTPVYESDTEAEA